MRGIPRKVVPCKACGRQNGCEKDQLCHGCRIKARPNPNKRFHWTAELDEMLRRAYKQARSRRELSASLDDMERRTGFSRPAILSHAADLCLNAPRKSWSQREMGLLAEVAGTLSKASIARKLGRSYWSVKGAFARLEFSARVVEGFTREDVAGLLGVSPKTVRAWIKAGWLFVRGGRITESSLRRFLCEHSEEYSLSRVDETWFKGMVFPMFGRKISESGFAEQRRRTLAAVSRKSGGAFPTSMFREA
jgi:DNA-binding CsgD family transcriptional regulator